MEAQVIIELAARVADIAETVDGSEIVTGVVMSELGDGSGRHMALVNCYDVTNDLEQTYRITTPAPWNSPAWASDFRNWITEVRTGDAWYILEESAATREP